MQAIIAIIEVALGTMLVLTIYCEIKTSCLPKKEDEVGPYRFIERNCWLCGKTLKTKDEADFLPEGDYIGFCKEHNIKEILKKTGHSYQLVKVKDRKMRRLIINLFLVGLFIEILIYFPTLIHWLTSGVTLWK